MIHALVLLNKKIVWQGDGIACEPRNTERELNHLTCSTRRQWEKTMSMLATAYKSARWIRCERLKTQGTTASMQYELDTAKVCLCKGAVTRKTKKRCEGGAPDVVQVQEFRIGTDSTVWPETRRESWTLESCSCGRVHPTISQCKGTVVQPAKSSSAGNSQFGQDMICSWSKDQTVIVMSSGEAEMYAACMAMQQGVSTPWNFKWAPVQLSASVVDVGA